MASNTSVILDDNAITSSAPLIFLPFSLVLFISIFSLAFLKFSQTNSELPPGPKPWPLLGCFPIMLQNKPVFRWIHHLMEELHTEIVCVRLGSTHVIAVTCPNLSCQILKQQNLFFSSRPLTMSTRISTNGYLSTALVPFGEQWKKMKRVLVTQMLSPAKHNFFYGKRLEEADHLVRHLYKQCMSGLDINVRFIARHYCGNLIRKVVFGRRSLGKMHKHCRLASFEDKEHIDAIFTMLEHSYAFCDLDYFPLMEGLNLDGHEKAVKEANEKIRKYHNLIIEERIKEWRIHGNKRQVEDLLDMFIASKDGHGNFLLSQHEIEAQITEIMMAVVDNPSNAVEWALAEMMNQPEILAKAVQELDRVVGKERLVEESDFSQLNYIKACVRETFRLHPIAAFNLPRVSIKDTRVGKYFIPKGSHILISRMGLGRNPRVWDDPKKFKPERHLTECDQVALTDPNLRFISFSTGCRGCPGVAMGTSMMLMLFARLLQGFSWKIPCNQVEIDLSESPNSLALIKPLIASAIPRLPTHVYLP